MRHSEFIPSHIYICHACQSYLWCQQVDGVYQVMWHIAGSDHIVQLHGVYEDKKSVHLVMDLCRGGELFDTIVAAGKLIHSCHCFVCTRWHCSSSDLPGENICNAIVTEVLQV